MNPIAAHDQALAFIMTDSLFLTIDGALSFDLIASQFEGYWRYQISQEIEAKLMPLCVCAQCGNEKEANLIQSAVRVAKKGLK